LVNVAGSTNGANDLGHLNLGGNVVLTVLGGARLNGSGSAFASEVGNYFSERVTAVDSITIKVFPGVPADAGFARPPADGTLAVGGDGLYYRSGGNWIKTGP
jgi:hypothetical protein